MKSTKVLILTGSYGNGHLQVTTTLEKQFRAKGITNVTTCDLFQEAHPAITKMTKYLYIKSFTVGQKVYGSFYYGTNNMKNDYRVTTWFNQFGMERLREVISKVQPDIIVNTFPMLVVGEWKKQTGSAIPVVHTLTDFCLHSRWLHPNVDHYFVASEEMKQEMIDLGFSPTCISVTGIPVRAAFEEKKDKLNVWMKYGLDATKKTILLMSGAFGVLKDTDYLATELAEMKDSQLLIVCGNNIELKELLEKKVGMYHNVAILGYVQEIDELMEMATVMITKPGGITLSEALAKHVPLVLYRAVPGQEKENAQFFEWKKAAVHVHTVEEVLWNTSRILENEEVRITMEQAMIQLYQPFAAAVIVDNLLEMVEERLEVGVG
ncbi:MGDG synthase family glycosyltransferase [Mangrovibacillus cuniculi]|uniref:Glycosyltransferase n=1 Tax=Mangrovibacillus cuniculi TaxID=2593652 RepID=A0A7S8CD60_9BACI|nr:glycosyltransferase [Mangrovibacillus cuniculi]QPC47820.1 glycosyltransferase [Mangrovibacillus cuniculi]